MVFERSYDQEMLEEINPLNELYYVNVNKQSRKVFQCSFSTVDQGAENVFILATIYDITERIELQKRLEEEEARRQEEMQAVFELIQVESDVFNDFMDDMKEEFEAIDKSLKNDKLSTHEALVKIYQSVHAIKSNSVILGLNVFGNKVHNLESKIKVLRESKTVTFAEMLNLTMEIEKLYEETEGVESSISKLQSYTRKTDKDTKKEQNVKVLEDTLAKAAAKAAEDLKKKVKFVAVDIEPEAVERSPRRVMKEILVQLVRNSVVHGIEEPDIRKAKNKNETGVIKLSIKMTGDNKYTHIRLSDDGKGLDYKKISQKALGLEIIKKEDADNKNVLMKAIFSPGFSTASEEGVHGGRGIGLNLVRDRIKEANGTIKLRSEEEKGTVFSVALPLYERRSDRK
jgi:two-component system chemotaxis sensor kinase CheA